MENRRLLQNLLTVLGIVPLGVRCYFLALLLRTVHCHLSYRIGSIPFLCVAIPLHVGVLSGVYSRFSSVAVFGRPFTLNGESETVVQSVVSSRFSFSFLTI